MHLSSPLYAVHVPPLSFFSILSHEQYWVRSTDTVISGSQSPRHGASSGCRWRNGLQYGGELRIYWIGSCGQTTRGGPPAWELDEVPTIPHRKIVSCYEMFTQLFLVRKQRLWEPQCGINNNSVCSSETLSPPFLIGPRLSLRIIHKASQHQTWIKIQRDAKRWTLFCTSIFPELYMVCEWST